MLLALDDPDDLREEASRMIDTGFAAKESYREALLRALEGNAVLAHRAAVVADDLAGGIQPRPRLCRILCESMLAGDPVWQEMRPEERSPLLDEMVGADFLVTFGGTLGRNEILAILLALEHEPWPAWAISRLRALPSSVASRAWPRFLEALALLRLGQSEEADALLAHLTRSAEGFPYAWLLREELARERGADPDSLEMIELRIGRAKAMGVEDLESSELPRLYAWAMRIARNPRGAVRLLENGVEQFPDIPVLSIDLAQARVEVGDLPGALLEYDRILEDFSPAQTASVVPEYLELLRRCSVEGLQTDEAWWARLEALETMHPAEPHVVLEVARRLVETAEDRWDQGVARARARLERFRDRTDHAPLEELRRGETARWVAFLARYLPEAALELADEELLRHPELIELWRARAEALQAVGRRREAVAELRTLLLMVTEPEAQLALTGLMAEVGQSPGLVLTSLRVLGKTEMMADRGRELALVKGTALLAGRPRQRDTGIDMLTGLLTAPVSGDPDEIQRECGLRLCLALLDRRRPEDVERACSILGTMAANQHDPMRRGYYQALSNLAFREEEPDEEPDEEPSDEEPPDEDSDSGD